MTDGIVFLTPSCRLRLYRKLKTPEGLFVRVEHSNIAEPRFEPHRRGLNRKGLRGGKKMEKGDPLTSP